MCPGVPLGKAEHTLLGVAHPPEWGNAPRSRERTEPQATGSTRLSLIKGPVSVQ